MDNALLQEAQEVELMYKEFETRRIDVRARVLAMLAKEGVDRAGGYTVSRRSAWIYTDAVKALEEKVKLAKVKEQQKGLAEEGTTEYLVFTPSV